MPELILIWIYTKCVTDHMAKRLVFRCWGQNMVRFGVYRADKRWFGNFIHVWHGWTIQRQTFLDYFRKMTIVLRIISMKYHIKCQMKCPYLNFFDSQNNRSSAVCDIQNVRFHKLKLIFPVLIFILYIKTNTLLTWTKWKFYSFLFRLTLFRIKISLKVHLKLCSILSQIVSIRSA